MQFASLIRWAPRGILLAVALAILPSPAVGGQLPADATFSLSAPPEAPSPASVPTLAPVVFRDQRLMHMIHDLQRNSPSAAAMLLAIREAGYPIEFGTFQDLAEDMRREYASWSFDERSAAGFMAPVVRVRDGFSSPFTTVRILVAINLSELDAIFDAEDFAGDARLSWAEIRRLELLSVLAHELVHAYGLAITGGDPRAGCHDPRAGDRLEDSCVMIGENLIRRELGAAVHWQYGFPTVASLSQRYHALEVRRTQVREMVSFRPAVQRSMRAMAPRPISVAFMPPEGR